MMFGIPAALWRCIILRRRIKNKFTLGFSKFSFGILCGCNRTHRVCIHVCSSSFICYSRSFNWIIIIYSSNVSMDSRFSFSAGLIDYVLSLVNPISNHPWMLLLQGVVFLLSITLSLELSYKSLI